ncbi:hypothetical protein PV05_05260 [Exophiala xenobiotica]|uniref:NAD-dependent epimerase/dehydratase domain-containing protein n=1 Tax=Exophiala xenobiotica TaxID=348802 RepID=A0A0D2D2J1_9EURO|nr:uncharacterized protein PV05_05260 [Exophiala xenobiotica]KIW56612.1 hypothetical protein PV05_05260 [Exophiala xenobiotica]
MAGELVLLTGSTGHIGYRTLIEALSQGYNVRAAVRSEAKAAEVKAAKSTQPYLKQLTFITVPNIEKEGAFDSAVKGVDYIVHLASPLPKPSNDNEANIIQPAIRGTLSILYSALKEPCIKKVVITSSVTAVAPSEPKAFTADNVEPDPQGPFDNTFAAYSASKKLAHNRSRDFIAQEKPNFDIINIMPTFVIGKNELATTREAVNAGSNAIAMIPILGMQNPAGTPAITCHVDDVALVHIASLKPEIKGNQNFGVNYVGEAPVQWDDAIDIVKKHFPSEVEQGIFPLGGSNKSIAVAFDASKTEEVFGIKFKSLEDQIVNLAGYYAGLAY